MTSNTLRQNLYKNQTQDYDKFTVPVEQLREFYTWKPQDRAFSVQLDLGVIDRLGVEVMRGFGAVRRRGAEVGGVLLGAIERGGERQGEVVVTVQDFVPVQCEYAQGPSYLLSPDDHVRFREVVERWKPGSRDELYAVGLYRSHTREGLALSDEDLSLYSEYFSDSASVVLLIKPYATKASMAGFFYQEEGVLSPSASRLEFPFRRSELPATSAVPEPAPKIAPQPEAAAPRPEKPKLANPAPTATEKPVARPPLFTPDSPKPAPYESRPLFADIQPQPSKWRTVLAWTAFLAALLLLGGVAGYQYAGKRVAPSAVAAVSDPYALKLSAVRTEDNVLVRWDSDSQAVRNAWRGLLTITEGNANRVVQMDVPQLRNGSVLYRHVAPEVSFRLEVFLNERRSVIETLSWQMQPKE